MTLEEKKLDLLNSIPVEPIRFNNWLVDFVILDPAEVNDEVEVFIRSVRRPHDPMYHYGPAMIKGTPADFIAAIEKMRRKSLFQPKPAVRTRTLDPIELQPYSDRYIQAFELKLSLSTLTKVRTDLWNEYKKAYIPKYTSSDEKTKRRHNFIDALEYALEEYKASLGKDPYDS